MGTEFLTLLITIWNQIWPFKILQPWERGGFFIFGHWIWEIGPGLYPFIPFFMEIHETSCAEDRWYTGRQDLTLYDGSTLSFTAEIDYQVVDVRKALCDVHDYEHVGKIDLMAVLADELAELDPDRLKPRRRGYLFKELEQKVAKKHAEYGIASKGLKFTSFVLGIKTHRLLMDDKVKLDN